MMQLLLDWLSGLLVYQLLTPLFAIIMIFVLISRKMRRDVTTSGFVLGLIIWAGASFVSLFPDFTIGLLGFLGIREGVRVLTFFGMIVLSFAIYKNILHVDKVEQEITQLTRAIALREMRIPSSRGDVGAASGATYTHSSIDTTHTTGTTHTTDTIDS